MTGIAHYHASDSDELAGALAGWSQHYTQMGHGRLQAELLHLTLPDASLIYERSNLHLHEFMAPPADQIVVAVPLATNAAPLCNAQPIHLDSLVMLDGGKEAEVCLPGEFRTISLGLSRKLLSEVLGEQDRETLEWALETDVLAVPHDAIANLREGLLASLNAFERGTWQVTDAPRTRAASVRALTLLMHTLGEATPPSDTTSGSFSRFLPHRRRLVQAAIERMREDITGQLSLPELSKHLNTCQRTLHYSFRQVCQTTPHQFFLGLRLAEARRRLKQDPQQNITDLALELGFYSSSHFSSQYKRQFAEQPSVLARG